MVDKVLKLDEEWRKLKFQEDGLRNDRNKISQAISQLKKEKKDASKELEMARKIPGQITSIQEKRKD